ncbi:MAG: hypothetical protein AAF208_01155 [Cyanobacteria bacterium P01_A01_bin.45]
MNLFKSKNGSVTIQCYRGELRIRLPPSINNGKQTHIYTNLDDTAFYRKHLLVIALKIEDDIHSGDLDTSLESYKAALKSIKEARKKTIQISTKSDLLNLWLKYAAIQEKLSN